MPDLSAVESALDKIKLHGQVISSHKQRHAYFNTAFQELKESGFYQTAQQQFLSFLASTPVLVDIIQANNADIGIALFQNLKENGARQIPILQMFQKSSEFFLSQLPNNKTILDAVIHKHGETNSVPVFQRESTTELIPFTNETYTFYDIPRRFHALFRGTTYKECVAGDAKDLPSLSARRILVPLLNNGHEIHVKDSHGRYRGYISTTALMGPDTKIFHTLEVLVPGLENRAYFNEIRNGQTENPLHFVKKSIFSAWFSQEQERTIKITNGYLVGQTMAIHNGQGLVAIRTSPFWLNGTMAGHKDQFKPEDSLTDQILRLPISPSINLHYSNNRLIIETQTQYSGQLVKLVREPIQMDDSNLFDPQWLGQQFSKDGFAESKLWASLNKSTFYRHPAIVNILTQRAHALFESFINHNSYLYDYANEFFLYHCGEAALEPIMDLAFGSVKNSNDFVRAYRILPRFPRFASYDNPQIISEYIKKHLNDVISIYVNQEPIEQIWEYFSQFPLSTSHWQEIIEAALPATNSATEFLNVISLLKEKTQSAHSLWFQQKAIPLFEIYYSRFLSLGPSQEQINALNSLLGRRSPKQRGGFIFNLCQSFLNHWRYQ